MKKVVSISFFGEGDEYGQYLPAFVRAHLNLFPVSEGWRLRVHCDDLVTKTERGAQLIRLGSAGIIDVVFMGPAEYTKAMLWRIAPVFEKDVDYVFCRDIDCCPMPRDRAVMEQFIKSGATVHTVHDNVLHIGMMGGLCGFHAPSFREITGFGTLAQVYAFAESQRANWSEKGTDQHILSKICIRPGGPTLLEHRFNGWHRGPTQKPRGPSAYPCPAYSAPIPHVGISPFDAERAAQADLLANHLGAAGFDHAAAVRFYDEHGSEEVARVMAASENPPGGSIMRYAFNRHSQNGEDGVLQEVFRRLKIERGVFVEFGAGNGRELSNSLKLAEEDWGGVWIEVDDDSYPKARALADTFGGRVHVLKEYVTPTGDTTIDRILDRTLPAGVAVDFMSIDIDSYDLEVFESLQRTPTVILIEINSTIALGIRQRHDVAAGRLGASFTSMVETAEAKGYRLVCHTGNLLFVRADRWWELGLPERERMPDTLFNGAWARDAARSTS